MADATFLILSYNQVEFLAETLESAFAQDFPSLEILVSDDYSSDGSLALAEQAAASCRGPHEVRVRRTPRNLGLTAHLYDAARAATTDFIVVSASDDRSRCDRVSKLWQAQRTTGAEALYSDYRLIDSNGRLLEEPVIAERPIEDGMRMSRYFPGQQARHILGMSSAYRKSVFETVPEPRALIQSEDLYFTLFLQCAGRNIAHVREALVDYRTHKSALSNRWNAGLSVRDAEFSATQVARLQSTVLREFLSRMEGQCEEVVDWDVLQEDSEFLELKGRWYALSLADRARAMARFNYRPWRRWMAPRLLGTGPFSCLKTVVSAIRG